MKTSRDFGRLLRFLETAPQLALSRIGSDLDHLQDTLPARTQLCPAAEIHALPVITYNSDAHGVAQEAEAFLFPLGDAPAFFVTYARDANVPLNFVTQSCVSNATPPRRPSADPRNRLTYQQYQNLIAHISADLNEDFRCRSDYMREHPDSDQTVPDSAGCDQSDSAAIGTLMSDLVNQTTLGQIVEFETQEMNALPPNDPRRFIHRIRISAYRMTWGAIREESEILENTDINLKRDIIAYIRRVGYCQAARQGAFAALTSYFSAVDPQDGEDRELMEVMRTEYDQSHPFISHGLSADEVGRRTELRDLNTCAEPVEEDPIAYF